MKQLEVVCGILHKADQVFIARRGEGQAVGIWEFPGGKVESGETHSEAIERELAEELGIHAEAERFLCRSAAEDMRLSAHSEGRWVHYGEVYRYGFQPADRKILDCLQEVMACLNERQK